MTHCDYQTSSSSAGLKRRVSLHKEMEIEQQQHSPTKRSTTTKRASVQFASTCDITFIERIDCTEQDTSEIWYTDDDFDAMRRNQMRSVNTACLLLSQQPTCDTTNPKLTDMMIGIENLLLCKQVNQCKMGCYQAVLDEQDRQYDLGIVDPERLALASQQYSAWSARRALKNGFNLAALYGRQVASSSSSPSNTEGNNGVGVLSKKMSSMLRLL